MVRMPDDSKLFFQKTLPVATTECYQMSDRLPMWVELRTEHAPDSSVSRISA